jgi:hypothetical protein
MGIKKATEVLRELMMPGYGMTAVHGEPCSGDSCIAPHEAVSLSNGPYKCEPFRKVACRLRDTRSQWNKKVYLFSVTWEVRPILLSHNSVATIVFDKETGN